MNETLDDSDDGITRRRCYDCFRPEELCFCDVIPQIDNRTPVLILQHARERFHPFNTARIVKQALTNSQLIVDQTKNLASTRLPLLDHAGLLYPGGDAPVLSDVEPAKRPRQLVIIDGTWHQAKTLVRDIPRLSTLPCYRLAPDSPGRYRIRREPNAMSLSTLEATVAALKVLEPNLLGLDHLVAAFNTMIEQQLAIPKVTTSWRVNQHRRRNHLNIPRAISQGLDNVVVAYGESSAGQPGQARRPLPPVYWVAQRLGSGECFETAIESDKTISNPFLTHLKLTAEHFKSSATREDFRKRWENFLQPDDTLAVYHQSTVQLLKNIGGKVIRCHVLKSVDFTKHRGTLEEIIAAEGIEIGPVHHAGRAGERLAKAVAIVHHLHEMAEEDYNLPNV
ncbi:MAG: DTW domain-containing protein [Planctomycetaceae bacterium]|nr:DTW domain-containing protein [Planctomycetaceae bacterium]